jgi:hypothetical protein
MSGLRRRPVTSSAWAAAGGGGFAAREGEGGEVVLELEGLQIVKVWLQDKSPAIRAVGTALGEPVVYREVRRENAVDADSCSAAIHSDAEPAQDARDLEAPGGHDLVEIATVNGVIGLGEVRLNQPTWKAKLFEASCKSKVVADIVTNVTAPEEGTLHDINQEI